MELAGSLAAGETWRPMEDAAQTHVLHSASQLFGAIKKSLQRCARFVSRGEAMLRLMAAFQARRAATTTCIMPPPLLITCPPWAPWSVSSALTSTLWN